MALFDPTRHDSYKLALIVVVISVIFGNDLMALDTLKNVIILKGPQTLVQLPLFWVTVPIVLAWDLYMAVIFTSFLVAAALALLPLFPERPKKISQ